LKQLKHKDPPGRHHPENTTGHSAAIPAVAQLRTQHRRNAMFRTSSDKSLIGLTTSLLLFGLSGLAKADTEHSTHIACYASVTTQCKTAGCSKADYDWGYDQCDQYYASSTNSSAAKPKRPRPTGLVSTSNNMSFRSTLGASLDK
jgi:hypothetical protein